MQGLLKFGVIFLGGGIGACLRYLMTGLVQSAFGGVFPLGTLLVNLLGCFAIGFLWQRFEQAALLPEWRLFVFTGILGGFTTFSSFGLETTHLLRDREMGQALANVLVSTAVGIALVFAGMMAARLLTSTGGGA